MPRGRKKVVFDPSTVNYNDPALKDALKHAQSEFIDYCQQIDSIKESQKITVSEASDKTGIPAPILNKVFAEGYKNFSKGDTNIDLVVELHNLIKS
jgi:hypothetical protein